VNLLLSSDSSVRLFFPKGGSGSIVFVIRRLIRSGFSDLPTYLMYDVCCSVAVKPWPLATRTHGRHAIGREVVWLVAYRASNTNAADSRSYDYFHQLKKLGVIRVVCLRI
jgi:hypothetical protein